MNSLICSTDSKMEYSSEDISDSDINDYEAKTYSSLKKEKPRVKYKDNVYRCPFCVGKKKQDYLYKDLLQHATDIGSSNRSGKEKAKHRALAHFLRNNLAEGAGSSQLVVRQEPPTNANQDKQYVWPWMGILVNVPQTENGNMIKDRLSRFNPLKVHVLWGPRGHTGTAIVDFGKEVDAFINATEFERYFERRGRDKRHWKGRRYHDSHMYGWVARVDDYEYSDAVGNHLKKYGDVKTPADLAKEESRKTGKLVADLAGQIEVKNKQVQELEQKYQTTSLFLDKMTEDRDKMHQIHNEELRKVREQYRNYSRKIIEKHEKMRMEMEKELDDKHKKLASLEQKKVHEKVCLLIEEQKKEKDMLLKRMLDLEKQQDAKQKLELEIEQMRGQLQVMTQMEEDSGVKKKMEEMQEELKDKIEDLDIMNDDYQLLAVKERTTNDAVQGVHKALVKGLKEIQTGRPTAIGIKRMGELDDKPFQNACKKNFCKEEADIKAAELSSYWQSELRKPAWHPYKMVLVNGKHMEVIDEEDEKLQGLKTELGDEAYDAVVTALLQMNEYNPSGRYVIPELWNFKDNCKATPAEVVEYIFKQLKAARKRKQR